MKAYYVAAAGLLMSTSALAWAPSGTFEGKTGDTSPVAAKSSEQLKTAVLDVMDDAGLKAAPASDFTMAKADTGWTDTGKLQAVAYDGWQGADGTKFDMSGTDSKAGSPDYLLLHMLAKTVVERF